MSEANERLSEAEKQRIELGDHVEAFLKTAVGQFLTKRAEEERSGALEALAEVDPTDTKEITRLQHEVRVRDSWQTWLAQALADADEVERQVLAAASTDSTGG